MTTIFGENQAHAGSVTSGHTDPQVAVSSPERHLEEQLIAKRCDLKYEHRADIRDRATLEANFRKKFEALNRVTLTDGEFQRLLDEIITPDVFTAARTLRGINSFTRDDLRGAPRSTTHSSTSRTGARTASRCRDL